MVIFILCVREGVYFAEVISRREGVDSDTFSAVLWLGLIELESNLSEVIVNDLTHIFGRGAVGLCRAFNQII